MKNQTTISLQISDVLTISGWFISAVSAAGIVFIKTLSQRLSTRISLFELAVVLVVIFITGLNLKRIISFFKIPNIRRVIRIKSGFTFIFCVLCALLLSAAGWFYPQPHLSDFGIHRPVEGEAGFSEPAVFLPGREVKLTVSAAQQRRLHRESMDGLWKGGDLHAQLQVAENPTPILLPDATTIDADESWDEQEDDRDVRYYRRAAPLNAPPIQNKPFFPWIKFNLPADPSLKGKQAVVHVSLTVAYPYLLSKDKYDVDEIKLDETIPIKIASDEEHKAYEEFLAASLDWELFHKIRLYALIVFCVFAAMIRLFVKF